MAQASASHTSIHISILLNLYAEPFSEVPTGHCCWAMGQYEDSLLHEFSTEVRTKTRQQLLVGCDCGLVPFTGPQFPRA